MWLHALQKRVRWLFSSRRRQSSSSSPSGQACAAAGTSELSDEVQATLHHSDAPGDPRDQQRRTPLHLDSANGHADVVRHLAEKSCQLNLAEELERAPLVKAVEHQQEECVAIMLEHGADPNLADVDSNTALHLAVLSGNTDVAGLLLEHNASSDAQNEGGYTPLNLAVSKQHEEMLECLPKKAADQHTAGQCERCFRTAQAFTTSHEADVEEDNLCLQEELERLEVELREVEEKYLNSERCVCVLKTAMDEKEREELAAAQELQDQLSAYFENQSTVKQLQEHMQRLEIKATSLEATVQQQSNRTEALLRNLQASLREVEEKYLNSERCVRDLKTALDEKEREATASAQKLQDQLSVYLETVKQLQEHMQRLEIKNTSLEATVQQQSNMIETLQRDLQATSSAQAAFQDFIKESRASHHDSLTNQLKDRIRDLERELDRIKDTQKQTTFQKPRTQSEVEKYKELYLKEVKISKCQAKELERANERLAEANAKLLRERHKNKSLITSSIVSGGLDATPVLYSNALGHRGDNLGLNRNLSVGGSFLSQCEMILLSRRRLANSVDKLLNQKSSLSLLCSQIHEKIQQKLDEKITKELKEATAALETGFAGSSKKFHLNQDPLCRTRGKYCDVLTKNYVIN